MNKYIVSGVIVNDPKYTVRHEFRETMLRAILMEDEYEVLIPLVFYNWSAERARRMIEKGMRVIVEGKIAGGTYIDENSATKYQNYLVVKDFSCTLEDTEQEQVDKASDFFPANKKFPLDVTDFEDMIQYMSQKG